jgi:glutathione S-transferase
VVHRWDEAELAALTLYFSALMERPSVARVVDEAREFRPVFPLPWPEYAA